MPKTKTKIYGTSELEPDFLIEAPELSIFLACVAVVNELRALAISYESGEISRIALSRQSSCLVAELTELVSATERFDIVLPVVDFGRFSPAFWRWFNWWNDFLREFTPRQVRNLERVHRRKETSSDAPRPKDHWLGYRSTPAFSIVLR